MSSSNNTGNNQNDPSRTSRDGTQGQHVRAGDQNQKNTPQQDTGRSVTQDQNTKSNDQNKNAGGGDKNGQRQSDQRDQSGPGRSK